MNDLFDLAVTIATGSTVTEETNVKNIDNLKIARVLELQRELDLRKELYSELDRLTLELQQEGFRSQEVEGMLLELVDNFADGKNTVFRPAGVKRFELKIKKVK